MCDLAVASSAIVGDTKYPVVDFPRYLAGDLERLLRRGEPGIHFFAGPPRVQDAGPRRTMDQAQLEALRALGYVGDDGEHKHR